MTKINVLTVYNSPLETMKSKALQMTPRGFNVYYIPQYRSVEQTEPFLLPQG